MATTPVIPAPAQSAPTAPLTSPVAAPVEAPAVTPASTPDPPKTYESELDRLYSSMEQPSEGETPAPAEEPKAASATPEDKHEAAADDKEPDAPANDELAEIDEDYTPDKVGEKHHWYTKSKAERLVQATKELTAMRNVVPDLSLDKVKELQHAQATLRNLWVDIDSGDPQRIANVMHTMVASEVANPRTGAAVAEYVVSNLNRLNPELSQRVENTILDGLIENLYREGQKDDVALALAQHLQHRLRGTFQQREDFQAQDPREAEVEAYRHKLAQYEQMQAQTQSQKMEAYLARVTEDQESTVQNVVDEMLSEVKLLEPYKGKREWERIKDTLMSEVVKAYEANGVWRREHDILLQQLQQRPTRATREAIMARIRSLTQQVVRGQRKAAIAAELGDRLNASTTTHTQLAQQAARQEPGAGSAPATPNALDALRSAKTEDDVYKAMGF
jgi:hypothetical protein